MVTETRTIRVQRQHQVTRPVTTTNVHYDDQGNIGITSGNEPPSAIWLWLIIIGCAIGMAAACADIIKELAITAQDNPVGIIMVGVLLAVAVLLIPTRRGRY